MAAKPIAPSHAQRIGRLGGSANTAKQNAARRKNAQRAGRPRRVCKFCHQPVLGGHVDRDLDASCGAHGWLWQQGTAGKPTPVISRDRHVLVAIAALLNSEVYAVGNTREEAAAGVHRSLVHGIRKELKRAGVR